MQHRSLIALSIAAIGLTAACSSAGEQVADKINDEAAKRLEVEADEVSTTCPDDAEAGDGETFECTVDIEGQDLPVLIEFTSDEDFTFEFDGTALEVGEIEELLKQDLATADYLGEEVTELDCPGESFLVIATDETIECRGTTVSGSEGGVILGLDDDGDPAIVDLTN
jgi:hypothetical protein